MLLTAVCLPNLFLTNYYVLLIIAIPSIAFIIFIIRKPEILFLDKSYNKTFQNRSIEYLYNEKRNEEITEIDVVLDKINKKGIHKLNKEEKELLDTFSKK